MGNGLTSHGARDVPRTNWSQVAVALTVLVVGALVYVLDRPGDTAPFFSALSFSDLVPGVFGPLAESLPTFAHVFALSLLSVAWFGAGKRAALPACLIWLAVDSAFEVGQHPQIAERLVQFIPAWFEGLPILGQADAYFLSGTFDTRDLISIAVGAAAAYLTIAYTTPRNSHHG